MAAAASDAAAYREVPRLFRTPIRTPIYCIVEQAIYFLKVELRVWELN